MNRRGLSRWLPFSSFKATAKKRRLLAFEVLESRALPATFSQAAAVDGFVADTNRDGVFDTVNTTGNDIQTSLVPGAGQSTDQSVTAPVAYAYNTSYNEDIPLGQEFKPTQTSLSFVELFIEDAGSDIGPGANFQVKIHSGTITGPVLGTSSTVFVPDGTNTGGGSTWTHFDLTPIALTPNATYVMEVTQVGSIVAGNSNYMLVGTNPSGTDVYPAGRAILKTPVTNNLDFLFREGSSSAPTTNQRGIVEFSTAGLPSSAVISSATLSGTIDLNQAGTGGPASAGFYVYAGDGQITTADATASSTRAGLLNNPALGTFSVNLDPKLVQGLLQSPAHLNYLGVMAQMATPQSIFIKSTEGVTATGGTVPTLTLVYDQPPVAFSRTYVTTVNTTLMPPLSDSALANDYDPDGDPLTAVLLTNPSHGAFKLASDGTFTYVPNSGFIGTDQFTFQATDGTLNSNTEVVTLIVNSLPVAQNDSYSVNQNTVLTVAAPGVLGNDSDVDGDSLSAVRVTSPTHGTLTLNANGSFTYTPTAGYSGSDSFTYKDSDYYNAYSNIATVTIAVNLPSPVAANDAYTVNEDSTLTVAAPGVLANDTPSNGTPLSAAVVSNPSHGTVSVNVDGSFVYTPATHYYGMDTFTYADTEGALTSNTATVTITVNYVNEAPAVVNDAYAVNEDSTLTVAAPGVLANDIPFNSTPMYAALFSTPFHGTVTLNAVGSFIYTPAANFHGTDSFTYNDTEGSYTSNVATVTITVNFVNQAPLAVNDAYTVNENNSLNVATAASTTSLTMNSQPGDYIGQGQTYNFTPATGTFATPEEFINDNEILFNYQGASGSSQSWSVDIGAAGNAPLVPGYYGNADRTIIRSATQPGLDVSGDGRGSNNVTGNFTVAQAVYGSSGNVISFDASFEQHSEGATPALFGEIKYNAGSGPLGVLANDSDVDGDTLTAILVSGPSHGALQFNADGTFTYTPAHYFSGTDSFTYEANDGSLNSNVATVTLTVNPVNQAPSFTEGPNQVLAEGAGAQTIAGWATAISAGPLNEASQALNFIVSSDNSALFAMAPAIDPATGTLTYTPAAGAVGSATVTVLLHDNGGTANGGIDTSAAQTFTISINNVPPTVTLGGNVTLNEGATLTSVGSFTDPGTETWTATVDYNDGSGPQPLSLNPDKSFSLSHVYSEEGTYAVTVTVVGSNTGSGSAQFSASVQDITPVVQLGANPTVHEGTSLNVTGSFVDSAPDTWTATVNYGDSGGVQLLTLNADKSFNLGHLYADEGSYTVTVTVADDDNVAGTATLTVLVDNPAPVVTLGLGATINEGSSYAARGSFSDPGSDTWTATVNYGDGGGVQPLPLNADKSFNLSHLYADEGSYTVAVTVSDDDYVSATSTFTVTVNDLPPTSDGIAGPATGVPGQPRTFSLTATDPSPLDQAAGFTFTINWGDGATQTVIGLSGTSVDHTYLNTGIYQVQLTSVTNTEGTGYSQVATQALTIKAVDVQGNNLAIGGTTGADNIVVTPADKLGDLRVTSNGASQGTFKPTGQIVAYGQAGNDTIQLASAKIQGKTYYVAVPAALFGGDGDDTLNTQGSTANNILVGGAGNDTLSGGSGRDLLIGGLGADTLQGNGNDDILIGDATDYDANLAALNAIMAEWGRTDESYATRVNHVNGSVLGGVNGSYVLNATTVHDDAAVDQLYGGTGMDWFFYTAETLNKDKIHDQASGEITTPI
jgi:large repetitive protein